MSNKVIDKANLELALSENNKKLEESMNQKINNHEHTKADIGLGNVPNVATNDQTPTFTTATTRENIATGEKLSIMFGKIAKFFADLKAVAFSGSYNDLSDKPTLGAAASKSVSSATTQSSTVYSASASPNYVPNMAFLSYWNGAYAENGVSNLAYCVKGAFGTAATKNVDTTPTENSANLITSGAAYELKKSVADGKAALATTLSNNGVTTASDATFATINTNIGTVATNKYNAGVSATKKGTAGAAQVLTGYTFTNASFVGANGTMANNGAVSKSLDCGSSYTVPAGYHDGKGKVTANSLASQTSATAAAGDVLSGKTAWVGGSKITGTITSKAAATYTPGTTAQTIAAGQYLSGAQTIAGDTDLVAGNIVKGKEIFGVTGTFSTEATNPITAADILVGKIGFVNGSKVTGTMANNGAVSQALNCGGSYTIPAGYHNGSGKVTANSLASQTSATAKAAMLIKGYTAWVDGSKITGTMTDYSSNIQTVATGATSGIATLDIADGFHTKIKVNNSTTYNSGYSAGSNAVTATMNQGKETIATTISAYGYSSPTANSTFDELADAISDSIALAQSSGSGSNIKVGMFTTGKGNSLTLSGLDPSYNYIYVIFAGDGEYNYVTYAGGCAKGSTGTLEPHGPEGSYVDPGSISYNSNGTTATLSYSIRTDDDPGMVILSKERIADASGQHGGNVFYIA